MTINKSEGGPIFNVFFANISSWICQRNMTYVMELENMKGELNSTHIPHLNDDVVRSNCVN